VLLSITSLDFFISIYPENDLSQSIKFPNKIMTQDIGPGHMGIFCRCADLASFIKATELPLTKPAAGVASSGLRVGWRLGALGVAFVGVRKLACGGVGPCVPG
jgi:hypothetical protein